MSSHPVLALFLEESINKLLCLDEVALASFSQLHGKIICFELVGIPLTLYFIPNQIGELQVFTELEAEANCTLKGSPIDLLAATDKETSTKQLFEERVVISGDTNLAHDFSKVLSALDIDWEEPLSKITGDTIAHLLGRKLRPAKRYHDKQSGFFQQNVAEYLVEEKQLLAHKFETEIFSKGVEKIRDDVDRIEARINRLFLQGENA